jgi:hypothetical protein
MLFDCDAGIEHAATRIKANPRPQIFRMARIKAISAQDLQDFHQIYVFILNSLGRNGLAFFTNLW